MEVRINEKLAAYASAGLAGCQGRAAGMSVQPTPRSIRCRGGKARRHISPARRRDYASHVARACQRECRRPEWLRARIIGRRTRTCSGDTSSRYCWRKLCASLFLIGNKEECLTKISIPQQVHAKSGGRFHVMAKPSGPTCNLDGNICNPEHALRATAPPPAGSAMSARIGSVAGR